MLKSFNVKNFRCLKEVDFPSLGRVNLIGGRNNVGKTSVLEAFFLHVNPTDPTALLELSRSRGLVGESNIEEEVKGLFFDGNFQQPIELISSDEQQVGRILTIRLSDQEEITIPETPNPNAYNQATFHKFYKSQRSLTTEFATYKLLLEYEDTNQGKHSSDLSIAPEAIRYNRSSRNELMFPPSVFIATTTRSPQEDAERFSQLVRVDRQDEVLQTLRPLEPRLSRLAILIIGNRPVISGDIGMRELVPIPLMGEGLGRLLSIVLAIANAPHGFVLIDEIENGLHYSVLVDVWDAIADAARLADVQVVATTHSRECILAAHKAFSTSDQYDFCYHRLERKDHVIQTFTYDQETLGISEDMDFEIR